MMFLTDDFEDDDNEKLKEIQSEQYLHNVSFMFQQARMQLIQSAEIVGINLPLAEHAKAIKKLDHELLEDAHNIMAAAYRYSLQSSGPTYPWEARTPLTKNWLNWFESEVKALIHYPVFVRTIVETITLPQKQESHRAQYELGCFLGMYYDFENWIDQDSDLLNRYIPELDFTELNTTEIFDEDGNKVFTFADLPTDQLKQLHNHFIYLIEDLSQNFTGEAKSELSTIKELVTGYNIHHREGKSLLETLESFRPGTFGNDKFIPEGVIEIVGIRRDISRALEARENSPSKLYFDFYD